MLPIPVVGTNPAGAGGSRIACPIVARLSPSRLVVSSLLIPASSGHDFSETRLGSGVSRALCCLSPHSIRLSAPLSLLTRMTHTPTSARNVPLPPLPRGAEATCNRQHLTSLKRSGALTGCGRPPAISPPRPIYVTHPTTNKYWNIKRRPMPIHPTQREPVLLYPLPRCAVAR